MWLKRLSIQNYKNIAQADIELSPNVNCLLGNNGMGKSNMLDALYYLSFCKSYNHTPDMLNVRHGEDYLMLRGTYERKDDELEIYCGIKKGKRKVVRHDNKEYERLSDHIGLLPLVMISPMDSDLIRGGSDERRRFIDVVISQRDHKYLDSLIRYGKALEQRNALLKQGVKDDLIYDMWETQMSTSGTYIYEARKSFLAEFEPVFSRYYRMIAGEDGEQVSLSYGSDVAEAGITDIMRTYRQRDMIVGYSTHGVHRDDMEMMLGSYPMRKIGSQGQCRTYVIALKLAQYDFLVQIGGVTPMLLLDDIFDKLDADRVERIINIVSHDMSGQIFITDTNRRYLDDIVRCVGGEYKLFSVSDGVITLMEEGNEAR